MGAGVETILWPNVTGRFEYLYVTLPGLGSSSVTLPQAKTTTSSNRFTDNILRVGLNYRFLPQ